MNKPNNLVIPFISYPADADMLTAVGARLDKANQQPISHLLWLDVPHKPTARFAMAHGHDMIFLKYYVSEQHITAIYRTINEPVYKDSCVELFIGFEGDLNYYNLEFNCAGTVLGEYGCGRADRKLLDRNLLGLIRTEAAVRFNPDSQLFEWELTIAIPTAVFEFNDIDDFAGKACRLNFFKCGDDLPEPHYLAWNPVHTVTPDFHRPEFFGAGLFDRFEMLVEL